MPIKMTCCSATGCETGLEAPANADVELVSTDFIDCGTGVRITAPSGLLGALGLDPATPPEALAAVLRDLAAAPATADEVTLRVKSTRLLDWLGAGANVATLVDGLIRLQSSGTTRAALAMLGFGA
ncbi:hypothetical protein ACHZ97_14545 [Lysobacter soli]|uniref:hypothetical protein n=1 Tax=Lysobacter soli TaxID=453783 RepID=UPI0037C56F6B